MKKILLTLLVVLLPILSMAFGFDKPETGNITINNISSVSTTDSKINMTDRRRIWKWFKRKQQKEEDQDQEN